MPDYSDKSVSRVDNLHHVEGLISVNDRGARRKEQQEQKQHRHNSGENLEEAAEESQEQRRSIDIISEDGHIDFKA